MTITYTAKVANSQLCCFTRLLFYWKGSIYQLIYKEMLIFISIYTSLSLVYRLVLSDNNKRLFEHIVLYCEAFTNLIPLSFIMGFYVAIVVGRWWSQFTAIPWPDRLLVYINSFVEGADERSRLIRRTLARYLSLGSLLVFQAISVSVKKRFPTEDHLIEAGVMTPGEKKCMEEINTPHGKWWAPFIWFSTLITQLRREGHSKDDVLFKTLLDELYKYRDGLGTLYGYDWICVPLVYTQVTTLAVYTYFLGSVIGQQFLDPEMKYPGHAVDLYVPVFTLLQFFFYMGWLKVAEQMINPFGEDDDDFDTNWIIDRNFQVSLIVVDDMYGRLPPMEKDVFWDEEAPTNLPYTKSSLGSFIAEPFMGSTANLSINGSSAKFVDPMETIPEIQVTESMAQSRQSIMSSPAYTRRIHSNLLTSLKSQLIGSKATLDNLKVNSEDVTAEPTPLSSPVHTRRSLHRTLLNRLSSQLDSSKGNLKQGADCKYPGSVPISRSNIPRVHSCIEDFMENNSSFYRDDGNLYSDGERSGPGMGKPSVSSEFINRIRANSFTRRRVEETIKAAKSQRNNLENPPLPPVQSQPVSQDTTQGILSHSGHEQCKLPAEKSSTVPDEEVKPINTTTDITNTVYSVPTTQTEVKYHHTEDGYMYEVPSSDQSTVNSLTPLLQSCQTSSEEDIAEELLTVVTVL